MTENSYEVLEEIPDTRKKHADGSLVWFCSFCGTSDEETKLVVGPHVAICESCVDICKEEFIK